MQFLCRRLQAFLIGRMQGDNVAFCQFVWNYLPLLAGICREGRIPILKLLQRMCQQLNYPDADTPFNIETAANT